jgi:DNA-binding NtrC family response regulator
LNRPRKSVAPELMELFLRAPWVGNVRELENVIIRGLLFAPRDEILPEDVGFHRSGKLQTRGKDAPPANMPYKDAKEEAMRGFHAEYLGNVLSVTQGNVSQAAKLCGLERQALQQLLRRHGIRSDAYRTN